MMGMMGPGLFEPALTSSLQPNRGSGGMTTGNNIQFNLVTIMKR